MPWGPSLRSSAAFKGGFPQSLRAGFGGSSSIWRGEVLPGLGELGGRATP